MAFVLTVRFFFVVRPSCDMRRVYRVLANSFRRIRMFFA